jgi:spermidine synthase
VELAERACEATGYGDPALLDTLAAAYAAAGRYADAVATARRALGPAGGDGPTAERLKLYERGEPFRDPALR